MSLKTVTKEIFIQSFFGILIVIFVMKITVN